MVLEGCGPRVGQGFSFCRLSTCRHCLIAMAAQEHDCSCLIGLRASRKSAGKRDG
jgi:hypothetical protein